MSTEPKLLKTQPGRDPERRQHQAQVKQALLTGQTWGLTYLLARVRSREPYDNYRVLDGIRQFEFTVKGVLRLEMMAQEKYKGWRRMFGSNTKAQELSTWRSRILVKAFDDLPTVRAYIEADPLLAWNRKSFPWPDDATPNAWYVLFQVQDVTISDEGPRLTELLTDFLRDDSELLVLVASHDVLPPAEGGTMNKIAVLQWAWQPDGPLVTGYSQNLAQAAGLIKRGEPKVTNLRTRDASHDLRPSFLATSVKGVFRTAAAWLVERVAREQGAKTFVTCDYGQAVPEQQRPVLDIVAKQSLCPVCRVFGGAGCLGDEVSPVLRQQGRVRFIFNRNNDATYGESVEDSPPYHWAWEQIEKRGKELIVEQLQFAPDVLLHAHIEPLDDFSLALLLLTSDLISSGFFRFGRFTTRGYGVVRLRPVATFVGGLNELLSGEDVLLQTVTSEQNGRITAQSLLGEDPLVIVTREVSSWAM